MIRKLTLNLHLFGALIGGLFLIILGGTGGIIAFQGELDNLLNPGLFMISAEGPVLPLNTIQESLAKFNPKLKPYQIKFPGAPYRPYIAQAGATQIFINCHNGEIIGTREMPSLLGSIRQLHTSLLLGNFGRTIIQAATWLSLFLIVSGLYLWWPLRNTGKARGLSFYLHLTFGLYFSGFLLILTITGLLIAYDDALSPLVFSAIHSSPPQWNANSTMTEGATPIPATDAIRIASERLPAAQPFAVLFPGNAKACYHITMSYPGDDDNEGSSWVLVDQYSGAILFTQDGHARSTGVAIQNTNGALHTGTIFGLPSKAIMSLSSFALVAQTITGYLIWWRKLRSRSS